MAAAGKPELLSAPSSSSRPPPAGPSSSRPILSSPPQAGPSSPRPPPPVVASSKARPKREIGRRHRRLEQGLGLKKRSATAIAASSKGSA
ncbi:hypothetical protein KSP39_PZI010319 [Platanthera zijinensis]|uniref:Uncharacterized protein n=1 Tax=Platanthera zijinensis TaxID=2320716 RepID=A0AAP0G6Z5_9ASPA